MCIATIGRATGLSGLQWNIWPFLVELNSSLSWCPPEICWCKMFVFLSFYFRRTYDAKSLQRPRTRVDFPASTCYCPPVSFNAIIAPWLVTTPQPDKLTQRFLWLVRISRVWCTLAEKAFSIHSIVSSLNSRYILILLNRKARLQSAACLVQITRCLVNNDLAQNVSMLSGHWVLLCLAHASPAS